MYRYGYHTFLWTFGITTFWHLIKCLKSLNRWVWLIPSELYQFQFVSYGPACIRFCCFVVVFFKMCSKKNFNWKCEAIVSSFSQCLLLQLHGKSFHMWAWEWACISLWYSLFCMCLFVVQPHNMATHPCSTAGCMQPHSQAIPWRHVACSHTTRSMVQAENEAAFPPENRLHVPVVQL